MSVSEITTFGIQRQLVDQKTASAEVGVLLEAGLSLRTSEGDFVTLNFSNEQRFSESQSETQFEDGDTIQEISSVAKAASTFSLAVEGDLNEDELAAIQKLAAEIEPVARDFFSNDLEEFDFEKAISVLTGNLGVIKEIELDLEKTVVRTFALESFSQVNLDDVALPDSGSVEADSDFDVENIRHLPDLVSATVTAEFEKQFQTLNKTSKELIVSSLNELMRFFREKMVQVLEPLRHPLPIMEGGDRVPVEADLVEAQPQE